MLQRVASPVAAVLLALFIATSFVNPGTTPSQQRPDFSPWIDTADRAAVVEAYQAAFGRDVPAIAWTGQADRCVPGDSSDTLRSETLVRIAYYRAMAGVPATVIEDPILSAKAQAAALMMSMEGELTHHPERDFACFSDRGQEAAANSNLYLGRTGPTAIDGYIEDPGDRNIDVGHRSTILHPPTEAMGIGHVAGTTDRYPSNALWVFDDHVFERAYETREPDRFVAWPPRGFVPAEVVYPRWSFALQQADFDRASVTMTDADGQDVPLRVVARLSKDGEIPSSIIVWEPETDFGSVKGDQTYTVSVSGVVRPEDRGAMAPSKFDIGFGPAAGPFSGLASGAGTFVYLVTIVEQPSSTSLLDLLNPLSNAAGG